jgi:hypothetical protein
MKLQRPIINFTKHHRSSLVGAQFIGAPPIYRPLVRRCPSQADKSAVGAINRPPFGNPVHFSKSHYR